MVKTVQVAMAKRKWRIGRSLQTRGRVVVLHGSPECLDLTNTMWRRYRSAAVVRTRGCRATWPNGSGNGLQSRVSGFDSRRRLHVDLSNVVPEGSLSA